MNYEKFTKEAFESLDSNSELVKNRLQELDLEVTKEIHDFVAEKMQEIINELNNRGHNLKRNLEIESPGETDFCETHGEDTCGFRLNSDITISSGYFGISDCELYND